MIDAGTSTVDHGEVPIPGSSVPPGAEAAYAYAERCQADQRTQLLRNHRARRALRQLQRTRPDLTGLLVPIWHALKG